MSERELLYTYGSISLLNDSYLDQFQEFIMPVNPKLVLHLVKNNTLYRNNKDYLEDCRIISEKQEEQLIDKWQAKVLLNKMSVNDEIVRKINLCMYWTSFEGLISNGESTLSDVIKNFKVLGKDILVKKII